MSIDTSTTDPVLPEQHPPVPGIVGHGDTTADAGHGHRHLGLALALISAAQLMVVLDGSIVNIALPHIQSALAFTPANLSWVVNGYTLAFGGLLLLGGRSGDLLGRRRMFMIGVGLFAVASLFGGLAQSEGQLLAARVLQGVGAAIASPTALSLITTTFPAGPARNRAFGVYAAMSGAGAAIGLILGGVLTEYSWRWTLFINVPIGLAVVLLAPRFLGESERQKGSFDLPGAVTGTAGLVSLVYGLTHAATTEWGNVTTLSTIVTGVALLLLFGLIEARARHALMPFRILADRTRAVSFVAMLVVGAGMFAMFYFLGLFVQQVLGYSALKAGLSFLPFSVGIVVAAQIASALMSRVDPRWIAGAGGVLAAGGMFGFSRLAVDSTYLSGLLPYILLLSVGLGLTFVPLTLTAVSGVANEDSGVGSAVLNTMQQVGGSIGLATLSTVAVSAGKDKAAELVTALQAKASGGGVTHDQLTALQHQIALQAQTHGATRAFLVAAAMVLGGAVIVLLGLNVSHETVAGDGQQPVHVG
ncbi:MAG TPA: MFS transporter [Actinomycetales bacterium]|nr:MFS transporter [Actinomycetales bacterium]